VKNVSPGLVPASGARHCGAFVGGIVLAENVKSIDAGQHREACEAALAEKSPNRPKAHLTTGEGRLDALCDADSLRHIFIEIEFDGAVGDRVEGHAERFAVALDCGAIRAQGRAMDRLGFIRANITHKANHRGHALVAKPASGMKANCRVCGFVGQFQGTTP